MQVLNALKIGSTLEAGRENSGWVALGLLSDGLSGAPARVSACSANTNQDLVLNAKGSGRLKLCSDSGAGADLFGSLTASVPTGQALLVSASSGGLACAFTAPSGTSELTVSGSCSDTSLNAASALAGQILLRNLNGTVANASGISSLDANGYFVARLAFVTEDHSNHAGSLAVLTRATGASLTEVWRFATNGDLIAKSGSRKLSSTGGSLVLESASGSITSNSSVQPNTTDARNLGAASLQWNHAYAKFLDANATATDAGSEVSYISFNTDGNTPYWRLIARGRAHATEPGVLSLYHYDGATYKFFLKAYHADGSLILGTAGNVGIGASPTSFKLEIAGALGPSSDNSYASGSASRRWTNVYSVQGAFSGQIVSTLGPGTAPFSIASSTLVANLNADKLDGYDATSFSQTTHKTHNWNSGDYGYDSYDQKGFLRLFAETARADIFRCATPAAVEYHDGTNWLAWTGGDTLLAPLMDGNETTGADIDHTHRRFRFQLNAWGSYPMSPIFLLQSVWNAIAMPTMAIKVEQWDNVSAWVNATSFTFGSATTGAAWGLHAYCCGSFHTAYTLYRVEINITDWVDAGGYTTCPLRRLLFLSNHASVQASKPYLYSNRGSASLPAIAPFVDTDTGIYFSAANQIDFTTGGAPRWSILPAGTLQSNGAQIIKTSTGPLTLASGAANADVVVNANGSGQLLVQGNPAQNVYGSVSLEPTATNRSALWRAINASGSVVCTMGAYGTGTHGALQAPAGELRLNEDYANPIKLWSNILSGNPQLTLYGYRTSVGRKYGRHSIDANGTYQIEAEQALCLNAAAAVVLKPTSGRTCAVSNGVDAQLQIVDESLGINDGLLLTYSSATSHADINNEDGDLNLRATGAGILRRW